MKNKMKLLSIVIAAFTIFTACANGENQKSENDSTIKIGSTFPLTGQYSNYGTSTLNGIQMAIDEINKNGGIGGQRN